MADKNAATPSTIREDIVPHGDVLLQLQQPYKSDTTAGVIHDDPGKEPVPAGDDPNKACPPVSCEPSIRTVELVVSSSILRLVSPVFCELLDRHLSADDTTTGENTAHVSRESRTRNNSNDSPFSLISSTVDTANPTPISSPITDFDWGITEMKKKKKKASAWGGLIQEESTPKTASKTTNTCNDAFSFFSTLPSTSDHSPPSTNPPPPSHPYILALPKDDSSAMTLLMRLVHFCLGDPFASDGDGVHSGLPSPELLEKLANVCAKYKCVSPFRVIGDTWIRENLERLGEWEKKKSSKDACLCEVLEKAYGDDKDDDSDDSDDDGYRRRLMNRQEEEQEKKEEMMDEKRDERNTARLITYCRLLVFAYVLDQPRAFTDLCWQIVLHHTGPIVNSLSSGSKLVTTLARMSKGNALSSPERILGNHPSFPEDILELLEMRRLASCHRFHNALVDVIRNQAETNRSDIFNRMKSIRENGLLVDYLSSPCQSISDLMDGIERLPENDRSYFKKDVILGPRNSLTCLDCIQTLGESRKKNKCRISHS